MKFSHQLLPLLMSIMTIYNGGVSVNILRHQATQLCQHYKKIYNSQLSSVHLLTIFALMRRVFTLPKF